MARRTLGDRQERFQIGFPREIEGHWVGVETGKGWEGPDDGAFKVGVREAAAIGGAEEPAVRHETGSHSARWPRSEGSAEGLPLPP